MADQTFDRNGLTSESVITGTPVYFITAFISLALYNVLELTGLIFTTFKKRKGLYFWSSMLISPTSSILSIYPHITSGDAMLMRNSNLKVIIATWGIALNATGFTLKFLKPDSGSSPAIRTLYTLLILVGWCGMVTGQSVVLYSRLYLLVRDKITLRFVLGMVIFDAILCHPPTIVLFVLTNSVDSDRYAVAYSIMEKCQLCVFFIQEVIISCIYIVESARFLKRPSLAPQRDRYALSPVDPRIVMRWLISINVIVIIFDMSVLGLEFSGYYDLQTSWVCTPASGIDSLSRSCETADCRQLSDIGILTRHSVNETILHRNASSTA